MADKRISQLVDRGTVVNNDVIPIVVSGATTTNKATISSIQTFMQGNLDVGVTSVGITLGSSGTDVNVSGSPVTSSGNITINIPSASATNRGLVTTGAQTFAGAKTFNSDLIVNGITVGKGGASNVNNTAVGTSALAANTTGSSNTATGLSALLVNTGGNGNTANGYLSLQSNTTGGYNVSIGNQSMYSNSTGSNNTAVGNDSLYSNITGGKNTGIGSGAGYYIADGSTPNTTSDFSIYLGADTKASADNAQNEIVIGYNAIGNGSNTVTIGNSSITSNKLFGKVIHADAVNANESATLGQVNTALGGYVTLATTQTITAQKTFTTSGGTDSVIISTTGAGFALDAIKAGNGEVIRVNKTSGTGNAMTVIGGNFEAPTIVKTGGTSAQFLKADGSVDSSTYLTTGTAASTYVPYTGATTSVDLGDNVLTSGGLNIDNLGGFGGALNLRQATSFSTWSGAAFTSIYATPGNNLIINFSNDGRTITLNGALVSAASPRTFTFPDATGTLALTTDLGAYLPLAGGTLTGALNGTSASFSSTITSSRNDSGNISATLSNAFLNQGNLINFQHNSGGTTTNAFIGHGGDSSGNLVLVNNSITALSFARATGAATFSSSVTLTSGLLSVDGFANKDTNYITLRSGFSPSDSGGLGFKAIDHSGSGVDGLACYGHDGISLYTAQTERMRITSGGNVGIGTTNPIYPLHIKRTTNVNIGFGLQNGGISLEAVNDAVNANIPMSFYASSHLFFNGNVGIGTASPKANLHVRNGSTSLSSSTVTYSSTTAQGLILDQQTNTNNNGSVMWFNNDDLFAAIASGRPTTSNWGTDLRFYTHPDATFNQLDVTERMRITSGGELFWKVTDITAEALTDGGVTFRDSSSNKFIQVSSGVSTDALLLAFYKKNGSSVTNIGSISTSGNLTLYNTTSDYRLKEDLQDFNALEKIANLKIYDFAWKADQSRSYGVLAHELAEVLPYSVYGEKDAIQEDEEPKLQQVDYSKIVPILIKAIQEQQIQIDSLKNQMK